MKPWEETWRPVSTLVEPNISGGPTKVTMIFEIRHEHALSVTERLQLAAQAPAMARLLLEIGRSLAWKNSVGECRIHSHDNCFHVRAEAVLRAAGVLP